MSKSREPMRLSHQKELGTMTWPFFSVTHHWTKKREKKTTLPIQPTTFQKCHSMPRNLLLMLNQASKQCIMGEDLAETEPDYNVWLLLSLPLLLLLSLLEARPRTRLTVRVGVGVGVRVRVRV